MKKFLIVLAMVVTASLLMGAGCFTVNTPPVITTLALPDATVGTAYTATVEATDADGDALTFSVGGPTGMVISEAGVISGWTPTESGTETVIVAVTDGTDLVSANFIITVSAVEPEPEPEPEPGLYLVGIEVDPETMELFVGESDNIDSVTATYVIRVYEGSIDLEDCLFLTSDSEVATVDEDGIVTAVKVGTADIIVSYKNETDTLEVTVRAYKSMEIIVDMPIFTLVAPPPATNQIEEFTIEIVANDDVDKEVLFLFTVPAETATPEYTLLAPIQWGGGSLIPGVSYSIQDSLFDEELIFEITFPTTTTITATTVYETTIEVRTFTGNVLLCSKDITAIVFVP